jgi:acetyltransferase-like isoleucine patch superfamily enzyme
VHVSGKAKIDTFKGGTISIDSNTEILDGVLVITYGGDIKIGKDCSINPYTIVYGHGNTTIGNNVLIAGGCMIIPSNHIFSRTDIPISVQGKESQGIEISDDVWIGHGCSILDGVKIGEGSVIAAGSVVTQSVEAYSIMGGVPARLLKKRVKEK